jgi:hypothetical protein
VALIVAAATLLANWKLNAHAFFGDAMLKEAMWAGLAALGVGALVALFSPARQRVRWLPLTDPFAETPFDPQA